MVCGDLEGLAHAQANLDSLTLRPAATPQRGAGRDAILAGPVLAAERERVVAALRDRPFDYVAQEAAPLSTMPGWSAAGTASSWSPPFVVRVFATRTPLGWQVMPGGFCRVSEREDVDPIELRLGIRSAPADVWAVREAGRPRP